MDAMIPETQDAIGRLEAALQGAKLPPRDAQRCTRLVNNLRRPVRIGLFGLPDGKQSWLLRAFLGQNPLPDAADWPTLEISCGDAHQTVAKLTDGSSLTLDGPPDRSVLMQSPAFLQIKAPIAALERMSFLILASAARLEEHQRALAWAGRRTDIAIWCTTDWSGREQAIWTVAPDALKNHAILAHFAERADATGLPAQSRRAFTDVFTIARDNASKGVAILSDRLNAIIDEARRADVDAARLLLHRFGDRNAPIHRRSEREADAQISPSTTIAGNADPAVRAACISIVSEPLLYLRRRARALLEMVEWQEGDADDWSAEVLSHCTETADGLRDRAIDWPEDDAVAVGLRRTLEEACDVTVLMGIEGGPEQAQDAAHLLLQLRGDFERALAA